MRTNRNTCFETFPFPEGLTPADTAHQQTEAIEGGALIPAGISAVSAVSAGISVSNMPLAEAIPAQAAMKSIATRTVLRTHAEAIAIAAKRPTDLREAWLIPSPNHPCTLSASLVVRLYCPRFAFAFTNGLEMESTRRSGPSACPR